LVYFIY